MEIFGQSLTWRISYIKHFVTYIKNLGTKVNSDVQCKAVCARTSYFYVHSCELAQHYVQYKKINQYCVSYL
jgi:hypothetical protein